MFIETVLTLTKAPRLTIGCADMDNSEDLLRTLTDTTNGQVEEDGTLKDASEAQMTKTRNQSCNRGNPKPKEDPASSSESTNGKYN